MDLSYLKYWPFAKNQQGVLNLIFNTSLNKASTICGESWSAWRFTYYYAWACSEHAHEKGPVHAHEKGPSAHEHAHEKGLVQNPSENSPRNSGETKISLELGVRSKSRDEQLFFLLR